MKITQKQMIFVTISLCVWILTACAQTVPDVLPPVAVIKLVTDANLGSAILIDGSMSYDASKRSLTYHWELIGKPAISKASLPASEDAKTTLTPDVGGDYVVTLYVNNGCKNSEKAMAIIHVTGSAYTGEPIANAGEPFTTPLDEPFKLDGSGSMPAYDLTFAWTVVSKPENSQIQIQNADSMMATCLPDQYGKYIFKLTVKNSSGVYNSDSICVEVSNYVSNIRTDNITYETAQIRWDTLGNSTSIVEYQAEGGKLERAEISDMVKDHIVVLDHLKPDTPYTFTVKSVDPFGNEVTGEPGMFQTGLQFLRISEYIRKFVYSEQNQKAYALDYLWRKIWVIDIPTFSLEEPICLAQTPEDIAIAPDRQSMFVLYRGSTFVTEISLITKEVIRNIYWPVCGDSLRIYYANQHLYIVDHTNTFWSMDVKTENSFSCQSLFPALTGMAFTTNQQRLYVWFRQDHSMSISRYITLAGTVADWSLDQKGTFENVDWFMYWPVDILLHEEKDLLCIGDLVIRMSDMKVVHRFPEVIYAINSTYNIAVGREHIYDLTDFKPIENAPYLQGDHYFFDSNNILYEMTYNDLLYCINVPKLLEKR